MLLLTTQKVWAGDLADKFVVLMRYEKQFEELNQQCKANAKNVPETLVKAEPDRFYGVRPGSKCWSKVVDAYNQYFTNVCSHPTREQFLNTLATSYRERLSSSQLQQAIDFYSSDIGEELISAHKVAAADLTRMMTEAQTQAMPQALTELDNRIRMIGLGEQGVKEGDF